MERRVVLLKTSERAGLVAELSAVCQANGVSIEISTGPGHVMITFEASADATRQTCDALKTVSGIHGVFDYAVAV
jgi:hypothetical protein